MSILIKGMEMPEHGCYKCFLREGNWCSRLEVPPEEIVECARKNERHKDCPLVEVPVPHGDLIDIDDELNSLPECYNKKELEDIIGTAHTIIEAEGKDE